MKHQSRTTGAARPAKPQGQDPSTYRAPRTFLIKVQNADGETSGNDNDLAADDHGAVVIAVVKDPARLLRDRGLAFHGDVIDLLTDLVIEAMERDAHPSD